MSNCFHETNKAILKSIQNIPWKYWKLIVYYLIVFAIILAEVIYGVRFISQFAPFIEENGYMVANETANLPLHVALALGLIVLGVVTGAYACTLQTICSKKDEL